jgi:hypothetical protein
MAMKIKKASKRQAKGKTLKPGKSIVSRRTLKPLSIPGLDGESLSSTPTIKEIGS